MKRIVCETGAFALVLVGLMVSMPSAHAVENNHDRIQRTLKAASAGQAGTRNLTPREIPKTPSVPSGAPRQVAVPVVYKAYEPVKLPQAVSTGPKEYRTPSVPPTVTLPRAAMTEGSGGSGASGKPEIAAESKTELKNNAEKSTASATAQGAASQPAKKKPARKFWNWFSGKN